MEYSNNLGKHLHHLAKLHAHLPNQGREQTHSFSYRLYSYSMVKKDYLKIYFSRKKLWQAWWVLANGRRLAPIPPARNSTWHFHHLPQRVLKIQHTIIVLSILYKTKLKYNWLMEGCWQAHPPGKAQDMSITYLIESLRIQC